MKVKIEKTAQQMAERQPMASLPEAEIAGLMSREEE